MTDYKFHNVTIPNEFTFGAQINMQYRTQVVATKGGYEQRNVGWYDPKVSMNLSPCVTTQAELDFLIAFFRARGGPEYAFRCRNWLDYQVTNQELASPADGITIQYQLFKEYATGIAGDTYTETRAITHPDSTTFELFTNGVAADPTFYTLDDTTGVITMNNKVFTFASPLVADFLQSTSPDSVVRLDAGNFITDGFAIGDRLIFRSIAVGDDFIFGAEVVSVSSDTLELNSFGGGLTPIPEQREPAVCEVFYAFGSDETLTWSGTYDLPVRFETETFPTQFDAFGLRRANVSVVEVRCPLTIEVPWVDQTIPQSVDAVFFDLVSRGSSFGPEDMVSILSFDSGDERRYEKRGLQRVQFSINEVAQTLEQAQALFNLFRLRKGRATQFCVRDLSDYQFDAEQVGVGDSVQYQFDLIKVYSDAEGTYTRRIWCPDPGLTVSGGPGAIINQVEVDTQNGTIDLTIGTHEVTFDNAGSDVTFNTGGIDLTTFGIANGVNIVFVGSALGNDSFLVSGVTTDTITLSPAPTDEVDVTVSVHFPPPIGTTVEVTGEFNVPVRFDTDEFSMTITNYEIQQANNINLVEVTPETVPVTPLDGHTGKRVPRVTNCAANFIALAPTVAIPPVGLEFNANRHLAFGLQGGINDQIMLKYLKRSNLFSVIFVMGRIGGSSSNVIDLIGFPGGFNHRTFVPQIEEGGSSVGGFFSSGVVRAQGLCQAKEQDAIGLNPGDPTLVDRLRIFDYSFFAGQAGFRSLDNTQTVLTRATCLRTAPDGITPSDPIYGSQAVLNTGSDGFDFNQSFMDPPLEDVPLQTIWYHGYHHNINNPNPAPGFWPDLDNGGGVTMLCCSADYFYKRIHWYGHARRTLEGQFYFDPAIDPRYFSQAATKFSYTHMAGSVAVTSTTVNGFNQTGVTPFSTEDSGAFVLFELILMRGVAVQQPQELIIIRRSLSEVLKYVAFKYETGIDPGIPSVPGLIAQYEAKSGVNGRGRNDPPTLGESVLTWTPVAGSANLTLHSTANGPITFQSPIIVETPKPRLLTELSARPGHTPFTVVPY